MIHGTSVKNMMGLMAFYIDTIAKTIADGEIGVFLSEILAAKRIYVMGAGRSGFVAKSFAMRLMHMGMISYVVGETITPSLGEGDLIVVFSRSGNTKTVGDMAEMAKNLGVKVALISSHPNSRIGKIADCIVEIETQINSISYNACGCGIYHALGECRSFAPLGTVFETMSFIFSDAVISTLMDMTKTKESDLSLRHINIE